METGSTIPVPELINRDLSEKEYLRIFNKENEYTGGAYSDIKLYKDENYQNLFRRSNRTGAGVYSFFSSIAKKSIPFLRKYLLPEALNFGTSLLEKSNNPNQKISKQDIKNLSKKSLKNIGRKVLQSSSGGKYKKIYKKRYRKKKIKRKIKNRKKSRKKIHNKRRIKKRKNNKRRLVTRFKIFENI